MLTITDIPSLPNQNIIALSVQENRLKGESYAFPDKNVPFILILSSIPQHIFDKYQIPSITAEMQKKATSFVAQSDFIALANLLFQGSTPLTGEEYDILTNTWHKSLATISNIEGML